MVRLSAGRGGFSQAEQTLMFLAGMYIYMREYILSYVSKCGYMCTYMYVYVDAHVLMFLAGNYTCICMYMTI